MKVYEYYRPRSLTLPLFFLGILGVGALVGFAWAVFRGLDSEPPPFVFLIPLLPAVINIWVLGGSTLEARITDDGCLEIVGPLRSQRVAVLDILSIAPSKMSQAEYVVRSRNGSLRLSGRLNGMHDLVAELKRQNATIDLVGL
jgi:hypothetical protein